MPWEGRGNDFSYNPAITPNGRYVAFTSSASNMVPGDTNGVEDVFVKDLKTGAVTRVSTDALGGEGNDHSDSPAITPNGRYVAFRSAASNLVPGDTNGWPDVFVKDLKTGAVARASTDALGREGKYGGYNLRPAITANGRYVVFTSEASNLVADDTNGWPDVFVKDLKTGAVTRVSTDALGGEGNFDSSPNPPSLPTAATWRSCPLPAIWWRMIPTAWRMYS